MARTLEHSDHTSVKMRYKTAVKTREPNQPENQEKALLPLQGIPITSKKSVPVPLTDYLALVNWTGCIVRDDKRGALSNTLPPILGRLYIDQQEWLKLFQGFEKAYKTFAGGVGKMKLVSQLLGYQRLRTS